MLSPFPGMNPYLEQFGSGVHHRLITAIANCVAPQIRPKYIVAVEERVYQTVGESSVLIGIPDVSVARLNGVKIPGDLTSVSPSKQPITVLVPQTRKINRKLFRNSSSWNRGSHHGDCNFIPHQQTARKKSSTIRSQTSENFR